MTRKNFKPAITAYILECLSEEDHGLDNPTDTQLRAYVNNRIMSEYGYLVERVGLQNAIREWLMGLAINVDYTYYDIDQRLKAWGVLSGNETENKLDKELDLYWSRLASVIAQNISKIKEA